jgi:hypothetical protein
VSARRGLGCPPRRRRSSRPHLPAPPSCSFNLVADNLCHELGIWEKQSSCYTQFKSAFNTIKNNIMYNGPRAHVNFNDGFGGGALLGALSASRRQRCSRATLTCFPFPFRPQRAISFSTRAGRVVVRAVLRGVSCCTLAPRSMLTIPLFFTFPFADHGPFNSVRAPSRCLPIYARILL